MVNTMLERHPENPLIIPRHVVPSRPDFRVMGAFNAAACRVGDETLLLLRIAEKPHDTDATIMMCPHYVNGEMVVERVPIDHNDWDTSDPRKVIHRPTGRLYLTSISHLRLARSQDGVHFTVEQAPWLLPQTAYEAFGIEDARITAIDGQYVVNYTAVSQYGIATGLVTTPDFVTIDRHGIMFPPANRDVTLFPERIDGHYVCYHRPMPDLFGGLNMWAARSPDLLNWGNHQLLLAGPDASWMNGRVGGGAPPVHTDAGWLSIFHAADRADRYCLGAFLTALDDPTQIIAMSQQPILVPEAPYEVSGFFDNVVFTCGTVLHDDCLWIYYGAADETIALAIVTVDKLLAQMQG